MTDNSVRVSVIIPTYNRRNVLTRAIKSVQYQTYNNIEIIIVDDCSTDGTADYVEGLSDERIRLIQHDTNKGGGAARNTGINAANGELVAFLDSDDVWLQEKIEKQLAVYDNASTSVGVVYSTYYRKYDFCEYLKISEREWFAGMVDEKLANGWIPAPTSLLLIELDVLQEINGFDDKLSAYQEFDLLLRISKSREFEYLREPLAIKFELQNNQISTNINGIEQAVGYLREKWKCKIINDYGESTWEQFERKRLSHLYWQSTLKYGINGDRLKAFNNWIQYLLNEESDIYQSLGGFAVVLGGKWMYAALIRAYYTRAGNNPIQKLTSSELDMF